MSGNQYVYSIEIRNADGGSNRLDLVHKNRKSVLARSKVLMAKMERTHRLVQETHHRDLSLLTFIHHDRSAVCDTWLMCPLEEYRGDLPSVEISIKAWIIKKAKPEGPVRGTLKEKMSGSSIREKLLNDPRIPRITLDEEQPSRGFADGKDLVQ